MFSLLEYIPISGREKWGTYLLGAYTSALSLICGKNEISYCTLFFFCSLYLWFLNFHYLLVYLYLIQNSPAVRKVCGTEEGYCEKDMNPRWQPRNGCDGRLKTKNLILTTQVN